MKRIQKLCHSEKFPCNLKKEYKAGKKKSQNSKIIYKIMVLMISEQLEACKEKFKL